MVKNDHKSQMDYLVTFKITQNLYIAFCS